VAVDVVDQRFAGHSPCTISQIDSVLKASCVRSAQSGAVAKFALLRSNRRAHRLD
jgi:hypothetical protein